MHMLTATQRLFSAVSLLVLPLQAFGQEGGDAAQLAKQLSNPISSLISVPLQLNYDTNIGSLDDGDRFTLNVQPVIPFRLNDDWNVISRTILPVVHQSDVAPGAGSQTGIGDIVQSIFFSPAAATASGWIWGAGPAFLLPTGTDDLLTADKWAIGPTAVALKQQGPWTYGALANHLWSIAGKDNRSDISSTFLQPFLAYNTPGGVTYTVNTESTFNWKADRWTIPVYLGVAKISRIGGQMVQWGGGVRYYFDSPTSGPEGLALRINFVLLFPK